MLLLALLVPSSVFSLPVGKGPILLPGGDLLGISGAEEKGQRVLRAQRGRPGGDWKRLGTVLARPRGTDVGDGNLVRLKDGRIWLVFRDNRDGKFAIRTAESKDAGQTWRENTTVMENGKGLWAPTLFATRKGRLICVYDDEGAPTLDHHQWLMGRMWEGEDWGKPFVVSKAPDGDVSRDGMAWLAETRDGRLVCAFEGVTEKPPYASILRTVESEDDGRTWGERRDLFRPKDTHMAVSPTLATMADGTLVCAFATDEDRETPDKAGTPPHLFHMDIKLVRSKDRGRTWSAPELVYGDTHRCYLPSLVPMGKETLATWLDFEKGMLGRIL